jgi:hypothetical protein
MNEMIIDIDDCRSLQAMVNRVSESWFNPEKTYSDFKANRKTDSPSFWAITRQLLGGVSESLGQRPAEFLEIWNQRCITRGVKIMGYHCTRHSDKQVFAEKGILPLSEETIKLLEEENQTPQARYMWEYRSQRSPGPFFLLSYAFAKNPDNHFCRKGPEILLACSGRHVDVNREKSVPLIIHCAIPYSILPDKDYYAFCILRAYFNFMDPNDEAINLFEGYSIDLQGRILDPCHILRIEEI